MVKVLKVGPKQQLPKVMEVTCSDCQSVLSVGDGEWRDGDYGSERCIQCPVCESRVIKPDTKYWGDF